MSARIIDPNVRGAGGRWREFFFLLSSTAAMFRSGKRASVISLRDLQEHRWFIFVPPLSGFWKWKYRLQRDAFEFAFLVWRRRRRKWVWREVLHQSDNDKTSWSQLGHPDMLETSLCLRVTGDQLFLSSLLIHPASVPQLRMSWNTDSESSALQRLALLCVYSRGRWTEERNHLLRHDTIKFTHITQTLYSIHILYL